MKCTLIFYLLIHYFCAISEQSGGKAPASRRLIGCLTTLYLMSKFQPSMLVRHAATLQPYLSTKCNVSKLRYYFLNLLLRDNAVGME